ncbi:hypothetical protein A2U01_0073984, partial [Trifolium medium]|nr:hypothetical protein [Trifolium medium]
MLQERVPSSQTLGVGPDRKPKILKRNGAKTTIKEGTR